MANKILIGSFNIRAFGTKKLNDNEVNGTIIKILQRYDICFIQEVRESDLKLDNNGNSPFLIQLLSLLNKNQKKNFYDGCISGNLGRNKHKEKYIFIYKKNLFQLIESFVYKDIKEEFEREPYIAKFRSVNNPTIVLTILGIHIKPASVKQEMEALIEPFNQLNIQIQSNQSQPNNKKRTTNNDGYIMKILRFLFNCICPTTHQEEPDPELGNIQHQNIGPIIMGDLNAGSSFISKKGLSTLKLYTDLQFTWLINNEVDTTVNDNDCALDRIIIPTMLKDKFQNAKAFRFDEKFNFTKEQALAISDHYPVEVEVLI